MPLTHPKRRLKRTARILHNEGIELTPEQVKEKLQESVDSVRASLKEKGHDMSKWSDDALLRLIHRMMKEHDNAGAD